MKNCNVGFRFDASVSLGTGHFMRCLTLAVELLKEGNQIFFFCADLPGGLEELAYKRNIQIIRLLDPLDGDEVSGHLQSIGMLDWLIVDHYLLDASWESQMRKWAKRIAVIDDLADRRHDCDILFDQNFYSDARQRYAGLVPETCRLLLGPACAILRHEFLEARQRIRQRNGTVQNILVFFGGTDPTNETERVLLVLKSIHKSEKQFVHVVVGQANPMRERIREICETNRFYYYCQIDFMAELMLKADVCIGAGGSTTWERCYLGLPTATIIVAENQRKTTEDLHQAGIIYNLGWYEDIMEHTLSSSIQSFLANPDLLRNMSSRALGIFNDRSDLPTVSPLLDVMRRWQ